jgi:two-component system, sensor histidine kinase and response regulator
MPSLPWLLRSLAPSPRRNRGHSPPLDAQAFIAVKELYDGEDSTALLSLTELFIRDAAAHIATLQAAIERNDAQALERAAHTLTSSSATIGALGMADLCGALQTLGRSGSVTGAGPLVEQLSAEFDRVQQAISQACAVL